MATNLHVFLRLVYRLMPLRATWTPLPGRDADERNLVDSQAARPGLGTEQRRP